MIICECCTNWRDLSEAKRMIQVAKSVNPAGLVKFQLFDAEADKGKPHYDWVKAHELTFEQAKELFDYGASIGQEVFFSVFAPKYVGWCEKIGVKRYKLASGFAEKQTVEAVRKTGKPIITSEADTICRWWLTDELLYCPAGYPQERIKIPCFYTGLTPGDAMSGTPFSGFSDHTIGVDCAKIALARGAQIIEKHFVLEDAFYNAYDLLPDVRWSMTESDLRELVRWEKVCKEVVG